MISGPDIREPRSHDADISRRVRLTLRQSRQPAFEHLEVTADRGSVVLTGQVSSFYLKQVVQTVAAAVDGVRRLDNQVEVVRIN